MNMIPQLIGELFQGGEYPAARELAIAYLRQKEDDDIRFMLAGIYHEEKKYEEALKKIASRERKIICVFGSLYLCGNILNKN